MSLSLQEIPFIGSSPKDFQGVTGIGSVWLDDASLGWRYSKIFEKCLAVEVRIGLNIPITLSVFGGMIACCDPFLA